MQLAKLENVVRRLYSDADFRARVLSNPDSALAESHLDAEERTAVRKLCLQVADGAYVGATIRRLWF